MSPLHPLHVQAHIFLLLSILFLILLIVVRKQIMFTVKVSVCPRPSEPHPVASRHGARFEPRDAPRRRS